jgi:hypothetical protein
VTTGAYRRTPLLTDRWLRGLAGAGVLVAGALMSVSIVRSPLVAGGLLGGIFCGFVYFRPLWGLYLLVALIPFQIFPMAFFGSEYTWSLAQVLVKLLFVVTVLRMIQSGRFHFRHSPLNLWIVLFMVVPVFSTLNAPDFREHIKGTIPAVVDLFLPYFVVLENVRTKTQLQRVIGALLATTLVVACVGTAQYLLGPSVVHSYLLSHLAPLFVGPGYAEIRTPLMLAQMESGALRSVASIFVNPSDYGGLLLYSFPLALALFDIGQNRKSRLVHAGLAFLFGFNILVSLARSAWLGAAAAVVLVALAAARRKALILMALLVLAVIMLGLSSVVPTPVESLVPGTVQQRAVETISMGTLSTSWRTRVGWWQDVLTEVSRSPLLGTGVLFKTHSQYFGLLLLFGALGLGLHLIIVWLAAHGLLAAARATPDRYVRAAALGACASLVGVSVHSLFWNDLFFVPSADMVFAVFVGVAGLLGQLARPQQPSARASQPAWNIPYGSKAVLAALFVAGVGGSSVVAVGMDFSPFDLLSYGSLIVIVAFVLGGLLRGGRASTVEAGNAHRRPPRWLKC